MPGGGASGEVIQPDYLVFEHARLINNVKPKDDSTLEVQWATDHQDQGLNIRTEIETAAAVNPFTGIGAYDPSAELNAIFAKYNEFASAVSEFDPASILDAAVARAVTYSTESVFDEAKLADAVAAHEARTESGYQRRVSGELATLLAGRAVMSSAYDDAVASMAEQRDTEINDFSARLGLLYEERRAAMVTAFVADYMNLVTTSLSSQQIAASLLADFAKLKIISLQDQINIDAAADENEARWRLELTGYQTAAIASYSGGGNIPKPPTKGERLLMLLGNSASFGIGLGQTTGNAGAGIAGFAGNFLLGALLQNWQ